MAFAEVVPCSTTEDTELVAFLSDIHAPFHDKEAVESALNFIKEEQPHTVVLNGDIQDFYRLSRFDKDPERPETLQDEIDIGNGIRRKIRSAAPNAVIHETEGNHEARLTAYIRANQDKLGDILDLAGIREALRPEKLFYDELTGIKRHGSEGFFLRENFRVKHGEFARQDAGMSAKAQMLRGFTSGITGHTHRLARFPFRADGGRLFEWFEGGCLCKLDAEYIRGGFPNWEQGFAVGQFSTKTSNFILDTLPVRDGKASWNGKVY